MNYRIYLICLDKTNELWMELYYSLGNTIPNIVIPLCLLN